MYKIDIHSNKETVDSALYMLDLAIKFGKKEKDRLVCVITGYGSKGTSHKIQISTIERLEELKNKNVIKDFIKGSNLDIFDRAYQSFKGRGKIPDIDMKIRNPGAIYILV